MSEQQLFVTLGHNASAAFAQNGQVIRAYEQERLDRKKSSSAYPKDAIELALGEAGYADAIFVSNWFDSQDMLNKYVDMDHLRQVANQIVHVNTNFGPTHHDAHAWSATQFVQDNGIERMPSLVIVMDGFGNNQECLSIYRSDGFTGSNRPRLLHRTYGYAMSLGLMYQYTTEFLGMKPHQDEYKLLGYESHARTCVRMSHLMSVRGLVAEQAEEHVKRMLLATEPRDRSGELIDYGSLGAAKASWLDVCRQWQSWFSGVSDRGASRACLAFCAQTFLEFATMRIVDQALSWVNAEPVDRIVLSGGCFYNVKLNRRIQVETGLQVFAHPLAGDQGSAFGLHRVHVDGLKHGERIIGKRDALPIGVEYVDEGSWISRAQDLLKADRIVNVVRGNMEFGPRALCNTSTLALPTRRNVSLINMLNERDTFMPMAPVCTDKAAGELFDPFELANVPVSDRFMITTVKLKKDPPISLAGVVHEDPLEDLWTARPQVVSDAEGIYDVLLDTEHETLINTSFNYHGEPIVYSEDDACKTHEMQCLRADTIGIDRPVTILVRT